MSQPKPTKPTDVAARVRDDERLDQAMFAARRRVIHFHRHAGVPLVVREGDAMIEIEPDAVALPEEAPGAF